MLIGKHTLPLPGVGAPLPHRAAFGTPRPAALGRLPLPPGSMPVLCGRRPLKRWRYIGFFSPEVMLCLAEIRIGPLPDAFWSLWDRRSGRMQQGTGLRGGRVDTGLGGRVDTGLGGRVDTGLGGRPAEGAGSSDSGDTADRMGRGRVRARAVEVELAFAEIPGVETICRSGAAYAWTRKQGGAAATARIRIGGRVQELAGRVIVDDTAAYYERHTQWRWSAGVGRSATGAELAWSLVSGVNDPDRHSERTVWVEGSAYEAPVCAFAADLSAVGELRFTPEAELRRQTNLGLVRSDYRQPFGGFSGRLPGGHELVEGFGVMEHHDAYW